LLIGTGFLLPNDPTEQTLGPGPRSDEGFRLFPLVLVVPLERRRPLAVVDARVDDAVTFVRVPFDPRFELEVELAGPILHDRATIVAVEEDILAVVDSRLVGDDEAELLAFVVVEELDRAEFRNHVIPLSFMPPSGCPLIP